ncbi:VCBS repeat-containing protein [Mariniflexile litorale]|uniref:VCBS repeat-containing protein n=1 Tax=Mariniflexile litorale TaxID=3045158 RepID=A0AAU7EKA1_9FLAO|nr:VCBS repeat-containing protein [Mariniflexile sp. KMM 9835]MDQ8210351.1 VCBS repeat-containing protein [Mariniflexile sp. KMM 9835]
MKLFKSFLLLIFIVSCSKNIEQKQFTLLSSKVSGIDFENTLTESDTLNYFNYPYIYMGGGIAVGDFNNDNLQDLYFTGNMVRNALYLNKGDLKFEDVTEEANAGLGKDWFLGATTVDINNDGWLDIYLSVSGKNEECPNKLLINQGINAKGHLTFKEEAEKYGIADKGHSTQSIFFDYDNDGDLDLYVANYPITPFRTSPEVFKQHIRHALPQHSNHLYKNNGDNTFTDVTNEAGVQSYSLSLSANVSDLNNDGYKDIYVSNDFASADFCYINNGDGTFRNTLEQSVKHTSLYGMGADIADFNNDGYLDIFQVDMDASTNKRSKSNMASMNPQVFWDTYNSGLYYQYMHNSLQLNTGILDNTSAPVFNNISRMANVSTTDWSWGPVFADLDNDGWKDLFVSNGTRREINNTDFFNEIKKSKTAFGKNEEDKGLENTLKIPSEKTDNFVFRNSKDLTFQKINTEWGLQFEGFTNGVAYVDLDNDGDLEIVLNNLDDKAVIFKNNNISNANYTALKFNGTTTNSRGIGVKCTVISEGLRQFQELSLEHGYISSMAPLLHFGMGNAKKIDTLIVEWPDGKTQRLTQLAVNKTITLNYRDAGLSKITTALNTNTLFNSQTTGLDSLFVHVENNYDDYKKEILLPHKTSNFGPYVSVGDLNKDGLDDFFISGASNQKSGLFYQNKKGGFDKKEFALENEKQQEDMGSIIFDADNDGDLDLYVVSGGNEFEPNSKLLQDRLYINDGLGNLFISKEALPEMFTSGSRVYKFDFDKDGDQDLLVCGRLVPGNYPSPAKTYLLENKSTGKVAKFVDVTSKLAPEFLKLGLATAASMVDVDKDGWLDIVVVGEWMPIRVFKNSKGKGFKEVSESLGLKNTTGWWFSLASGDFDNDGDIDFVAGNLGLNYKYKSSNKETFDIYFNDFDNNQKMDIVLSYYNQGKKYPVRGRSCSSSQVSEIKNKFKTYNEFAEATLVDVYGDEELENSLHYQVNTFATTYIENKEGTFILHKLPNLIQFSSINQLLVKDFNKDGNLDILAAGNLYASEIETPRNDAGTGMFLAGKGNGTFTPISIENSGFYTPKDVKDLAFITIGKKQMVIVANNNDAIKFIQINSNNKRL